MLRALPKEVPCKTFRPATPLSHRPGGIGSFASQHCYWFAFFERCFTRRFFSLYRLFLSDVFWINFRKNCVYPFFFSEYKGGEQVDWPGSEPFAFVNDFLPASLMQAQEIFVEKPVYAENVVL